MHEHNEKVNALVDPVKLPKMAQVRQIFEASELEDAAAVLHAELNREAIRQTVKPGMSICVTAGSRGICHIDLLILNFLDLLAERRYLLFLLAVLLREFCQPRLLLLHLKLRHGQVFLRAAAFASLHIVVPGFAHIPEEIVLQNAVGFFENGLALYIQNRLAVLVQRGLGSPLLAHADLLDYLLDRSHQRFILAAFRPQDLLLYDRNIDHMKVVVVHVPPQSIRHGAVALVGVHDRR